MRPTRDFFRKLTLALQQKIQQDVAAATSGMPSGSAPVTSVNTKTGNVVIGKSDVGLANVDNTSDANKPISAATQNALNGKMDANTFEMDPTFVVYAPSTTFNYVIPTGVSTLLLDPPTLLATGQVTLPAVATNGQIVTISTTKTITAMAVVAATGQTVKNSLTTILAGGKCTYIYVAASKSWYVR